MDYKITTISIGEFYDLFDAGMIDLSPHYQRNPVWTVKAKRHLLDTIEKNYPLPNIFFYEREEGKREVVDGQQRLRALLHFREGEITTENKKKYSEIDQKKFHNYKIPLVVIKKAEENESIEDFYTRVNTSGLRLNKPEVMKAEYHDTTILKHIQDLSEYHKFTELELFSDRATDRLKDVDLVSEIVALLHYGITDKKEKVDKLLKEDSLETVELGRIEEKFKYTMDVIYELNKIKPIKYTRYKQVNDFYTLVNFISQNSGLYAETYKEFYRLLCAIDKYITPSNEDCECLWWYAINCVSQSNSAKAREQRYNFMRSLLLNKNETINDTQREILQYLRLDQNNVLRVNDYTILDYKKIA